MLLGAVGSLVGGLLGSLGVGNLLLGLGAGLFGSS